MRGESDTPHRRPKYVPTNNTHELSWRVFLGLITKLDTNSSSHFYGEGGPRRSSQFDCHQLTMCIAGRKKKMQKEEGAFWQRKISLYVVVSIEAAIINQANTLLHSLHK